jgi:hypothetical protein
LALQFSPLAIDILEGQGNAKLRQVKVLVCTETCILSGYTYCMNHQRLLDALNQGFIANSLPIGKDFVPLTKVEVSFPNREREFMASICVRKASILFVGQKNEGQPKISEVQDGLKIYPVRTKKTIEAEIHIPLYTLTGQMYGEVWQQILDVVDRADRFLPLTNVEVCPTPDIGVSTFDFVAVNRDKIVYVCESSEQTKASMTVKEPAVRAAKSN